MNIDTEITGQPGQIESAASWLRDKREDELTDAGDEFNDARKDGAATWNCGAGDSFVAKMKTARDKTDDAAKAAKKMGDDIDTFAGSMRTCQSDMATIRKDAKADGLTVDGFIIQNPAQGPAEPTLPRTPEESGGYNDKVKAYNAHQELIRSFIAARSEAERIDRKYATACRKLQEDYTAGQHALWMLTLGEITGDGTLAAMAVNAGRRHKSKLLGRADDLLTEAKKAIDDLQAHPERYMKRKWIFFKTLDETKLNADKLAIEGKFNEADELLKRAGNLDTPPPDGKLPKGLKATGKILGPLGFGLGVYNDYQEGESTAQIAVSQGGSLLAGMGTGAAVGAAVGSVVPVAGTAVGAVVGTVIGAGVAIFSDGMIDSFFENGPDIGKAAEEGWNSIVDTGKSIGDGLASAGKAIGGWFD